MGNSKLSKQEREKIRIEMKRKYEKEILDLKEQVKETYALREEIRSLRGELEEKNSQIASYEEWLERMQEYCNMSDEELEGLKVSLRTKKIADEALQRVAPLFSSLLKYI